MEGVWFGGLLGYRVKRNSITIVYVWFEHLLNGADGSTDGRIQSLVHVAFTCWNIWKSRCNVIFNHKLPSLHQTLQATSCAFTSFLSAQVPRLGGNCWVITDHAASNTWPPPPGDRVKINVDVSWRANGNLGYIGVVVRHSNSRCLVVRRRVIRVLKGCLLAQQHGFTKVVVESDSNEAISLLNGCIENGYWGAFLSLCKIQQLGESFHACVWS